MTEAQTFDDRSCLLGEGPLWHPLRNQLFWFDIMNRKLLSRDASGPKEWLFDEYVSAAGWIDHDTLLIASQSALTRFDLRDGSRAQVAALEADNPATRSNDGRADPWGGFWIGTMGIEKRPGEGAIYRFYQGKLTRIYDQITISNAICFAPDRSCAYYTDTVQGQIMRQPLDKDGWPKGAATLFVDCDAEGLHPDGAIVDREGYVWNAQWGAGRVARYSPDGRFDQAVAFPAAQVSCPAFGGEDLTTLFATTAREGFTRPAAADGCTYAVQTRFTGQAEHQVRL